MLLSPDSHMIATGIESWKLWSFIFTTFVTVVLTAYKGYQWIRGIRTEEFPVLKDGLGKVTTKIEETSAAQLRSTEYQTQAVVRELAELRGLLYGAFHVAPPAMAPARSRKPATKKKPAKVAPRLAPARKSPKK